MLKSNISLTAWVVVICQLTLKRTPRWQSLPSQEHAAFYAACAEYCKRHSHICLLLGLLPPRVKIWLLDQALAKGAAQHFVLRKQAIAHQVLDDIEKGARQLVVVGGGFDPLAISTAMNHPNMQCFEIDTPAMHDHKMAIATQYYGELPKNFHAISVDLSQESLHATLSKHKSFKASATTLFIAEGLTMYLKESDIFRLFSDVKKLCKTPASILFTVINRHQEPRRNLVQQMRDALLSSSHEQFNWSMPEKDMAGFLVRQSFMPQYTISYAELQRPWRDEKEMDILARQNGEYMACATAQA